MTTQPLPTQLRELSDFYAERPCVDETERIPLTQEISRRECQQLTALLSVAAEALERAAGKPKRIRSIQQHNRYFAVIAAAFMHWPDDHEHQFDNSEDLRKFLQMKAGHREVASTVELKGMSKENAMLIAEASIKAAGSYAAPRIHGDTLVVFKPKSIATEKLDPEPFSRLNDEVAAVIFAETGMEAETLLKECERAA